MGVKAGGGGRLLRADEGEEIGEEGWPLVYVGSEEE